MNVVVFVIWILWDFHILLIGGGFILDVGFHENGYLLVFSCDWLWPGLWVTMYGVTPGQVRTDHQDGGAVSVSNAAFVNHPQSRSSTTHPITLHSPLQCLVCFEVHKLKTSSWWTSSAFISHVRTDCAQTSSERIFNVDCNNYPGLTPTWHTQHASEH